MNPLQVLSNKINELNLWDQECVYTRNDEIKSQNTTDTNLYFIVEGSVRVYVIESNEEHTIRFGYKNNFIAALDSYITEEKSDLIIQALKKTKVKIISKKKFVNLINTDIEAHNNWLILLEQLVFQQLERERDILTTSPQDRYNRVLSRSPQLFQEIPNKYIASYLRMTPETLSRLKKS